jgi:formylglycine-generating enzyme required for sulfatase activity
VNGPDEKHNPAPQEMAVGSGTTQHQEPQLTEQTKVNRRVVLGIALGVGGLGVIYHFWPNMRFTERTVEFPLPGGLAMTFCWIPPGYATLGSPTAEKERFADEKQHLFTTKGFWLGKYPVTQGEWSALMGINPSHFQAGGGGADKVKGLDTSRFPVESVSWNDCQELLRKLNAVGGVENVFGKPGKFGLPHENAWEYACRGGKGNDMPFYWGYEINGTQANMDGDKPYGTTVKGPHLGRPTPVGSYATKFPHPGGLCDMHGNVWEWCENFYEQTTSRVARGGCWLFSGEHCRAACRVRNEPDYRAEGVGLRVLLSAGS